MNRRMVAKIIGGVLLVEAIALLPAVLLALFDGTDDLFALAITSAIAGVAGLLLFRLQNKGRPLRASDGFASVAITWIVLSIVGCLPFLISGYIPNFIDALFETISGFTTTGSTILGDVEALPRGLLLWRSCTHWLGGMGVLVLALAILPNLGEGSINLLRAESPGPNPDRLMPGLGNSAKMLYMIYLVMTVILIVLLMVVGMPPFDAVIHGLGAAGTGGFSNRNASVGAYNNPAAEVLLSIFMLLFGVNFSLYFYLVQRKYKSALRDDELRFYGKFVFACIAFITVDLVLQGGYQALNALRHSSFQVSTIVSTTGYSSENFDIWPLFSRIVLVILMLTGPMAGSTGGGIKMIRILVLWRAFTAELRRVIHPRAVAPVKINGSIVEPERLHSILVFFFIYMLIFIVAVGLVSLDNTDFTTAFTSVFATLGNIGPGLSLVGPMGNFALFSPLSKIVLSFCMLAGRLEIFPLLVILAPHFWRRGRA